MLLNEGKTNWLYILLVTFLGVIIFLGIVLLQRQAVKEAKILKVAVSQKIKDNSAPEIVPLPTKINQNFLTQVDECFIPIASIYGYTLRITSGFRSLEEQNKIYEQGRVEDGNIVSWATAGKSMHNYGYAIDVVDRWRGYYINWKRLARIANFCGLEQVDDPHFEYRGGLSTEQFEAGLIPEPLTLPCEIMSERAEDGQELLLEDLENCGAPNFWNNP